MDSICSGEDYNSRFGVSWYLSAVYGPDCYLLQEGSFLNKLHDELSKLGLCLKMFKLVSIDMILLFLLLFLFHEKDGYI